MGREVYHVLMGCDHSSSFTEVPFLIQVTSTTSILGLQKTHFAMLKRDRTVMLHVVPYLILRVTLNVLAISFRVMRRADY